MKTICFPIIITIFFLLSSCSLYVPTVVNAPVFTDKNELQLAGFAGSSGTDIQLSYSASDHLAFALNFNHTNVTWENLGIFEPAGSYEYNFNNTNLDVLSGYYSHINHFMQWGFYGSLGTGYNNGVSATKNSIMEISSKTNSVKLFIQPQFSIYTKFAELTFSTRILNNYYITGFKVKEENNYKNVSQLFFEPVMTGKIGLPFVKFIIQAGISVPVLNNIPFQNKEGDWGSGYFYTHNYYPYILSMGWQFRLSDIWKKKP